jgi:hypothetical protein
MIESKEKTKRLKKGLYFLCLKTFITIKINTVDPKINKIFVILYFI